MNVLPAFEPCPGRLPFKPSSAPAEIIQQQKDGTLNLGRLPDEDERAVIPKATRPDPAARYASCTELVRHLAACVKESSIVDHPVRKKRQDKPQEPPPPPIQRDPGGSIQIDDSPLDAEKSSVEDTDKKSANVAGTIGPDTDQSVSSRQEPKPDRRREISGLLQRGRSLLEQKNESDAKTCFRRALDLLQEADHPDLPDAALTGLEKAEEGLAQRGRHADRPRPVLDVPVQAPKSPWVAATLLVCAILALSAGILVLYKEAIFGGGGSWNDHRTDLEKQRAELERQRAEIEKQLQADAGLIPPPGSDIPQIVHQGEGKLDSDAPEAIRLFTKALSELGS